MNFKEEYQKRIESVEELLRRYLPAKEGYQQIIVEAMEYSLMAGGKRLRPILMRESYELFGGNGKVTEPFMAAIEMIHTYSLVHDDLPAMDNDDYRRGRKTTHVVYGEDMGILAGDALLNYAFETACKAFDSAPGNSMRIRSIRSSTRFADSRLIFWILLIADLLDLSEDYLDCLLNFALFHA